ncbi:MAG: hypothetical protein HF978_06505 [Desulfobacteraceae bacterium]|nr:hypothetical protein [Desulfobacteraceae bacterium]MBC2755182.1 hypothetical protein [Desulfobacteraceae bacterium]
MDQNLEKKIAYQNKSNYKSEGERKIAEFLDNNQIQFQYEPAVLLYTPTSKSRIWYPDFHLPEFKTYIEYYGLAGDPSYNQSITIKQSTYSKNAMNVIPVYPWMLSENWQGYIMKNLEKNTIQTYRNLMSKPYWSKAKTPSYPNNHHMQRTYSARHKQFY